MTVELGSRLACRGLGTRLTEFLFLICHTEKVKTESFVSTEHIFSSAACLILVEVYQL
jgi:hypothetical protein